MSAGFGHYLGCGLILPPALFSGGGGGGLNGFEDTAFESTAFE